MGKIQEDNGNLSPTINNVFDSIIKVYPKIKEIEKSKYECLRSLIIKHLKAHNNRSITKDDMFKNILIEASSICK